MGYSRKIGQDVQVHSRSSFRIWFSYQFWRWKIYWFRFDLRHHGFGQKIRTKIQVGKTRRYRTSSENLQKTKEGKKKQNEKGPWYQEGQGWNWWKVNWTKDTIMVYIIPQCLFLCVFKKR